MRRGSAPPAANGSAGANGSAETANGSAGANGFSSYTPASSAWASGPGANGEAGAPVGRGAGAGAACAGTGRPFERPAAGPCCRRSAPCGRVPFGRASAPGAGAAAAGAGAPWVPAGTGAGSVAEPFFWRGRNQAPVDSDSEVAGGISHSGGRFGGVAVRAPPSITPSTGEVAAAERCRGPAASGAAGGVSSPGPSSFLTVERTTTGGIGREPGMLIRTRVVSVVSVFGASSSSPGAEPWPAPAPARSPPGKPGVP